MTAHDGSEHPAELGRMPVGSRVTWSSETWEVCDG
jgi:hypothetical protein